MKIIHSRLDGVEGNIVEPDAVQFASRKVAAVSGDARRALDICRRAVELAEADSRAADDSHTPSTRGKVTIATIKRAINEATTNPVQQYLRSLPFTPKLLLAAMLLRIRRTGIAETTLGDVVDEMGRIMASGSGNLAQSLLGSLGSAGDDPSVRAKGLAERGTQPVSACYAALELMEAGVILLEAHRSERHSKMRLAVGDDEIKLAIRDDTDIKGLGVVL
jgi:origin recognition complex subunit 1